MSGVVSTPSSKAFTELQNWQSEMPINAMFALSPLFWGPSLGTALTTGVIKCKEAFGVSTLVLV